MNTKPFNLKQWLNSSVNSKPFALIAVVAFTVYLFDMFLLNVQDTDMHFLIATGREIISNGIPDTNIWIIDSNAQIVVQQWLYCVAVAYFDSIGIFGTYLLVVIQIIIFSVILYKFCRINELSPISSVFCICLSFAIGNTYVFSIRPQLITLILLFLECLALEKWVKTDRWIWLICLPISTLIEVNVHSSMWPMHFAVLLAYVVPSFYYRKANNQSIFRRWKLLIPTSILMFLSLFANPYGWNGIIYTYRFFTSKTSQYISVSEHQLPYIISGAGFVIVVSAILIYYATRHKNISSVSVNIAAGITLLMIISIHNQMFSILVIVFLLRDALISFEKTDNNKILDGVKNYVYPFLVLGIVGGFAVPISVFTKGVNSYYTYTMDKLSPVREYIDSHYQEGDHIFTGFNTGAYFEYYGYKNIYMDARPELYSIEFNKERNIIGDYSRICVYGYSRVKDDKSKIVTEEEISKWLDEYDFQYLVIQSKVETYLNAYLMTRDDYRIVDDVTSSDVVLYERVN